MLQLLISPPVSADRPNQQATSTEIIDLNQFPLFIHEGFSADYVTSGFIPFGKEWIVLSPSADGNRSMRIIDIEEFSQHHFLSFNRHKPQEYTYAIPFYVSSHQYIFLNKPPNPMLALHLASIGDNWEVYLNGKLLRSEMHRDEQGNIVKHRNYRDVLIPFSATLLRNGPNKVVFRIIGNPANPLVGLNSSAPYRIGPYSYLKSKVNDLFDVTLSLIYIFIGIYIILSNLTKYAYGYNQLFGLFSIVLGFYFFTRTSSIYFLISDSEILFSLEITFLFLILPVVTSFLSTLSPVTKTQRKVNYCIYGIYSILIIAELLFHPAVIYDLTNIWAIISIITLMYDYIYLVIWKFFLTLQSRLRNSYSSFTYRNVLKEIKESLLYTPIGNILIGITLLVITSVIDTYGSIVLKRNLVTSRYSLIIFLVGGFLVIARNFLNLFNQLNTANNALESQLSVLRDFTQQADHSQKIYLGIFNNTEDPMIFTDKQLVVQEYNRAADILFGPEIALGKSLSKVLQYISESNKSIADELSDLKNKVLFTSKSVQFAVNRIFIILLEPLTNNDLPWILVRFIKRNPVYHNGSFVWGKGTYSLDNSMAAADAISLRITSCMGQALENESSQLVHAAIREMICNAIEYGNLEISPQEKTEALQLHKYDELLNKRKELPQFKDRRAIVKYIVTPRKALIKITDGGKGFDYKTILNKAKNPDQDFLTQHQGLFFALAAFDRVVYNDKGNQVLLEKNISG
jgi:hypothetical protein